MPRGVSMRGGFDVTRSAGWMKDENKTPWRRNASLPSVSSCDATGSGPA